MALTSKISKYDCRWPNMFDAEKARLEGVFGTRAVEIHHVGSTAVPGLAAKPEIDLLVVVSDHGDEAGIDQAMASFGYIRGTNLSDGHHFIAAMLRASEPIRSMFALLGIGRFPECCSSVTCSGRMPTCGKDIRT